MVEYSEEGKPYVYVSDAASRAIVVYDVLACRGYRVLLPQQITLGCGRHDVLYLSLIRKRDGSNVLYFSYLAGQRLFAIKTVNLRRGSCQGTVVDVGMKPSKLVYLGTDNGSSFFFRYKGQSDVYMWNTETCFKAENFVLVQNGDECRLATQVVPGFKKLMWVLESNFPDYIQGTTGCLGASVLLHPLVKSCDS